MLTVLAILAYPSGGLGLQSSDGLGWNGIPSRRATEVTAPRTTHVAPFSGLGLNVRDFGAVGDGVTDDAGALQAAITAATNQSRALLFPAGTSGARPKMSHFLTSELRALILGAFVASACLCSVQATGKTMLSVFVSVDAVRSLEHPTFGTIVLALLTCRMMFSLGTLSRGRLWCHAPTHLPDSQPRRLSPLLVKDAPSRRSWLSTPCLRYVVLCCTQRLQFCQLGQANQSISPCVSRPSLLNLRALTIGTTSAHSIANP